MQVTIARLYFNQHSVWIQTVTPVLKVRIVLHDTSVKELAMYPKYFHCV